MGDNSRPSCLMQPVTLGDNTVEAQYEEITPYSAFKEIADNANGIAHATRHDGGPTQVGVLAYTKPITTRKAGEAEQRGHMLVYATETKFDLEMWKNCLRRVDPKKDASRSHLASVHGMGTSNATIGLGKPDYSGQCLLIRRTARDPSDPMAKLYPCDVKWQRFGRHANAQYAKKFNDPGTRATAQGDLLIYPDGRSDAKVPFMASSCGYGAYVPKSAKEYKEKMQLQFVAGTMEDLLDDSPFALNAETDPHPHDLCDGLIDAMHGTLDKLADLKGVSKTAMRASNVVLYYFFHVRDEICTTADGALTVGGKEAYKLLASQYLPHNCPTRELLAAKGAPLPDPTRLKVRFGANEVDFGEHWLLQNRFPRDANEEKGTLPFRPVSYSDMPLGVYEGEGFTVESYMVHPHALLRQEKHEPKVVVHSGSGLAIGSVDDFTRNSLFKNSPGITRCITAALDVHNKVMGPSSISHWLPKENSTSDGHALVTGLKRLVPEVHKWSEDEFAEIMDALKTIASIQAQLGGEIDDAESVAAKGGGAAAKAALLAKKKAELTRLNEEAKKKFKEDKEAWTEHNPNATRSERCEKLYELSCRAGGNPLRRVLCALGYMLCTGHGITHVVVVHNDDLAVDKPKTSIMGQSATMLKVMARLPRLNKEIALAEIKKMADWRAADLAVAKAAEKAAKEKAAAERAAAEEERRVGREKKAKDTASKAKADTNKRMKEAGCLPRSDGSDTVVFWSIKSRSKGEVEVGRFMKKDAEAQLRAGTLILERGAGKGKAFIFAGADPRKGTLFKGKSPQTEIVVNPDQGAVAAAMEAAAKSRVPPARARRRSSGDGAGSSTEPPGAAAANPEGRAKVGGSGAAMDVDSAEVVPQPELKELGVRLDDDDEFSFYVFDTQPEYVNKLLRGHSNQVIMPFIAATRSVPRIVECFSEEGGLEMVIGKAQRCRLRVVPVLCAYNGSKRAQTAMPVDVTMHNGVKLVTVYLDVEHAPHGGSPDIVKGGDTYIYWVAAKVSLTASEEYARALAGGNPVKTKEVQMAIFGQMCMPAENKVANQFKVASIDLAGESFSRKRKAPGDDAGGSSSV